MYLSEDIARKLINLNPDPDLDIIDPDVAERQFQVILKGFNHLIQPENNFLYIADEVGLGKTYIAIGIAALLRYFSDHPEIYNDVIIVPKQNLQYKWQKEINNFIQKNYLLKDNIVKSILNKPAANLSKDSIKHHLTNFCSDFPNYVIYRNSSFSIASDSDESSRKWLEKLKDNLPDYQKSILEKVFKKFSRQQILVKRAYAYLLNQSFPAIDLLIVDEAHNFKHGAEGDISIRNQVVSRTFGAHQVDEELFTAFPELKENILPKIQKLLFLSATPINTQLYEIKNQLDCFLYNHIFKGKGNEEQTEAYINKNLNKILIRGLMTITVNQKQYSRNSYRHEHRLGNVIMTEEAEPQYLKDNKTALVLCLMQYKTIKELKQKNNNQFEIGMLAGFESFENNVSKYEDETLENRKENEAKDELVIRTIVESYLKEFSDYPPHPKQDSLINELFDLMLMRQKALVFVRRIASVRELERKLYKKYSDYIIDIVKKIRNYKKYSPLKKLIEKSELENDREDIERIIDILADRITHYLKSDSLLPNNVDLKPIQIIGSDLRELFNAISEVEEIENFQEAIKKHMHRKTIMSELRQLSIDLLKRKWNNSLILDEDIEEDEITADEDDLIEEKSPYFFQRFFYNEGKNFKKKIYRKDWFELNLILINEKYNLFQLDNRLLSEEIEAFNEKVDFKNFGLLKDRIKLALRSKDKSEAIIKDEFRVNTFLTEVLLELCCSSFDKWIDNHKNLIIEKNYSRFIEELDTLNEILRSVFRQGSGLIPTFIADALTSKKQNTREDFIIEMKNLLSSGFNFVLQEIDEIIYDYNKIIEKNFDDPNKIRFTLIQQLPVLGISGHHKRDVRKSAIQFRMPGYPYILIATDILKEGEDLHSYCKNIYHYGIAWNPSDMEQRTGRVDRIDSLAYRLLKQVENEDLDEIPFNRKLQVFYPYLSDTLEVNQMANLFIGMNKFIDIFYNDLSQKIEKNSKAKIDELIELIVPQRSGLLESKYDINNFSSSSNDKNEFGLKSGLCTTLTELQNKLLPIYGFLKFKDSFLPPELDASSLRITGVLNIRSNRQGPYVISIGQKKQLNRFEFRLESCLGRVSILGSNILKQRLISIFERIQKKYGITITREERNSLVWLQITSDIENDINETYKILIDLIYFTDRIEASFLKKDEKIKIFT
jgi:hypothetical protein